MGASCISVGYCFSYSSSGGFYRDGFVHVGVGARYSGTAFRNIFMEGKKGTGREMVFVLPPRACGLKQDTLLEYRNLDYGTRFVASEQQAGDRLSFEGTEDPRFWYCQILADTFFLGKGLERTKYLFKP